MFTRSGSPRVRRRAGGLPIWEIRACLIIGDTPNSKEFFCQTRQIFAGILSYGKEI